MESRDYSGSNIGISQYLIVEKKPNIPKSIKWAVVWETYDVHNHSILYRTCKTLEKFILGNYDPENCGPTKRLGIWVS